MVTVLVKFVPFLAVSSIAYHYVFSNCFVSEQTSYLVIKTPVGNYPATSSDKFVVWVYDSKEPQFTFFITSGKN